MTYSSLTVVVCQCASPDYDSVPCLVPPGPGVQKKRQWEPPESPYDLVQERYYQDPWKLLIGTILLSKPPG